MWKPLRALSPPEGDETLGPQVRLEPGGTNQRLHPLPGALGGSAVRQEAACSSGSPEKQQEVTHQQDTSSSREEGRAGR